jgi:methyl-accepting chemotaxis protein-1 (serine sensor receptor)
VRGIGKTFSQLERAEMFRHMSVKTKLILLVSMLVGALVATSAFNGFALHRAGERTVVAMKDATRIAEVQLKTHVQEWKNLLIRGGENTDFAKYSKALQDSGRKLVEDLRRVQPMMKPLGLDPAAVDKAIAVQESMDRSYAEALKAYDPKDPNSTQAVDRAVRGIDRAAGDELDELVKVVRERGDVLERDLIASASAERNATLATLLAVAAVAVILATILAVVVIRSIVVPLAAATDLAQRVAQGDLTSRVPQASRDEIGQLLGALGTMTQSLSSIVSQVRSGAESVSAASSQIAVGSSDLSTRTEEQASSIEETAASVEELTSTVSQNANNAKTADQLAAEASKIAASGGEVVSKVVRTMDEISGSSKRISEIIGVIDGIAFQTNILALNAAVEAARAGEQGRGFAVVASEVRSLAQRSASAAKEIKGLITDSVKTVDTGSRLVDEAGKTMQDVVRSVQRVTEVIGQISAATQEQSAGIGQVNTAVTELDRATQQNAALVEECAAASESLKQQAHKLAESVSVFKVADASVALPSPVVPPTHALASPSPTSRPLGAAVKSLSSTSATARLRGATAAPAADEWQQF